LVEKLVFDKNSVSLSFDLVFRFVDYIENSSLPQNNESIERQQKNKKKKCLKNIERAIK